MIDPTVSLAEIEGSQAGKHQIGEMIANRAIVPCR